MNTSVLPRLHALLRRLYAESEAFRERTDDAQLWYNRGYANGMLAAIEELGYADTAAPVERDPDDVIAEQAMLPWGQAYQHGFETGHKETCEVLPPAAGTN